MQIRVGHIGDDLKELVRHRILKDQIAESNTIARQEILFAQRCGIQPQRLRLWLIGEVEFQQTNLERIGKQLIKEL